MGFMVHGFVESSIPMMPVTEVSRSRGGDGTWLTGKQFLQLPGNMGSVVAWFRATWRPRDIDGEETTQRETMVGPITCGELVV